MRIKILPQQTSTNNTSAKFLRRLKKFSDPEPQNDTDNTDRFRMKANMSVLSGGFLDPNLENMGRTRTDNTNRFRMDVNMSVLSVPSPNTFNEATLRYDFEERLAIAEYDGHQPNFQAQRIAYLDAFVSVLVTLPQENFLKPNSEDWLDRRIKEAKSWLSTQGLEQPK